MAFGNKNVVAATFVAKDDASKTVNGLRNNMKALGSKTGGPLGGVLSGFASMPGPALAAGAAIGAATAFLASATKAAIDEEKGIARLDQALENNVEGWNGNRDAIEGVISERQKLAFSDGDLRDSLGQLVSRTHDVNKAFELQAIAMDLARAKNISLADASGIIGKVYSGNVAILNRYGISVEKGATATEALAAIQKMAGGQAEAFANTTEGAMQSAQIALDDVSEDIGGMLLPVLKDAAFFVRDNVIPTFRTLAAAFTAVNEATGEQEFAITSWYNRMQEVAGNLHVTFVQPVHEGIDLITVDMEELGVVAPKVAAGVARTFAGLEGAARPAVREFGKAPIALGAMVGALGAQAPAIRTAANVAFSGILAELRQTVRSVNKSMVELGPGMRSRIISGKDEIRAAMAEIEWALKHPFAEDKYADWLARQERRAQRKRLRALRTGNTDAVAEIDAFLAYVREQRRLLNQNPLVIRQVIKPPQGQMVTPWTSPQRRATGGALWGNDAFLVGENGPEMVYTKPGVRGNVDATPNLSGGSSGPNVTQIYLDGRLIYEVVNERTGRQLALDRSSTRTARN